MRSYDPDDKYDIKESERIKAEPWQLELLKINPSYTCWGPREDYMWKTGEGWDSRVIKPDWKSFDWGLDELNECVNFYFSVNRESKNCAVCDGTGYHPDAKWVSDSFYEHSTPFNRGSFPSKETVEKYGPEFEAFCQSMRSRRSWNADITEDEAQELIKKGRGKEGMTAASFNAEEAGRGLGHDAINRGILIRTRCERMGVPVQCTTCEGHGYVYTAEGSHISLTLWMLHPRKGCSRGVEVTKIEREQLPEVFAFLREAAQRNAERFSKLPL